MSCEYRRRKFLGLVLMRGVGGEVSENGNNREGSVHDSVTALERIYQQAYDAAYARRQQEKGQGMGQGMGQGEQGVEGPKSPSTEDLENKRKTHLLFAHMLRLGVQLPVHSPSGLPKPEAQAGYAALWDVLKTRMAENDEAQVSTPNTLNMLGTAGRAVTALHQVNTLHGTPDTPSAWVGPWLEAPDVSDSGDGTDLTYDQDGYDKEGYDRTGTNRYGFDRQGSNRDGYDRRGYDAGGRDHDGYDKEGYGKAGYNRAGSDKEGRDRQGYDWMGFDRQGFDPTGYNKYGYNRSGFDKDGEDGYDREGYNKKGYNRRGYNRQGLDAKGVDRFGYDAGGFKDGFDKQGYDAGGLDPDGYDRDGHDKGGYDRGGYKGGYKGGYNKKGRDRSGNAHPWWVPDAHGHYGDGYDAYGFNREGFDGDGAEGRDRWGFDRQGFNELGRDRDGYNKEGYNASLLDREKYNQAGFDSGGSDRLGYNAWGQDRSGYSITGYDKDGYDRSGVDRWGRDRNNRDAKTGRQYKNPPHNKSGFDKDGYDRWGFHRDTGLTADRRNYAGWVYNPDTKRCHNPSGASQSMQHSHYQDGRGVAWQRPKWQTRLQWDPSVTPKWDLRAPMSWEEYARVNGTHDAVRRTYEARLNRQPNLEERWRQARAKYDPNATSAGVPMRCPQCGQFTGYKAHQCPAFGNRAVTVLRSGLARREGAGGVGGAGGHPDYLRPGDDYSDKGVHADTRQTMDGCPVVPSAYGPFANGHSEANQRRAVGVEERDPAYANGGYNRASYDQDGSDRFGRDRRGRDGEGYDAEGYDWLGRDRDGYDRHGRDRNGYNRAGVRRPRSLKDLEGDYSAPGMDGDILANEGVRRLYSQVATSLAGKPRQVVFQEGGGFATDMHGTIYLDPYPLGREAPLVYNAAVVMEGLQHEMGHELETPLDTFKRILEIASSPEPVEGLDAGRPLVKQIYNIVEDGRMERRISLLPGVAEYLAVGCKLQPRWDEQVGEAVPLGHEVQGALLYEALPYYQVRSEVLGAMTPRARALFEELRPIVHQGVFGEAEDAYQASVRIARRLQEEGITAPDEQLHIPAPAFFFFAGAPDGQGGQGEGGVPIPVSVSGMPDGSAASGSGKAATGTHGDGAGMGASAGAGAGSGSMTGGTQGQQPQQTNDANGASPGAPTAQGQQSVYDGRNGTGKEGNEGKVQGNQGNQGNQGDPMQPQPQNTSQGQSRGQSGKGSDQSVGNARTPASGASTSTREAGGGDLHDVNKPFSNTDVKRALDGLERDLAEAAESDLRRQSRVEVLGRNLHKPIGGRQDAEQLYRDAEARVRTAGVQFPTLPSGDPAIEKMQRRRTAHRAVARQMARYLENVQDVAEETLNFQTRGRMDRHRFVEAMKDAPDVYKRRVEVDGTGFALSVAVDVSGSMGKEMKSGALCDAAMVLSDVCEELAMPYEVRSFSGRSYQYKAMDDPTFSMERAAMLINGEGGGTNMAQTAGLAATSLLARPERNKLFVSLTDGDLSDHDSTMQQMDQARRDGVLTFGIFLSRGGTGGGGYVNRERMDQIYGKANWTVINSIQEMPRAVGQRIALLMRRAR